MIECVGRIEGDWARKRWRQPDLALEEALERLRLLQRALRRRLLDQRRLMQLNRRDPLGSGADFAELDMLVDSLWLATEAPVPA